MSRTLIVCALALGACTYDMPANIDPLDGATLQVTSGDAQSALVGTTLAAPIVIQATDLEGNPLADLTLALEPTGGGRVPEPAIRTDAQGFATTVLTLGTVPGENRVTASVLGLEIEPAVAIATALVGPPTTLAVESGDGQRGTAGYELAAPLVVRAADEYGNPVPEAVVDLAVLEGGGTLSAPSVSTTADGTARATLVLGTTMGTNRIEARLGVLPPVQLTALGVAGAPAALVKTFGDAQSAPAGATLGSQLTVRVDDEHGNPVENQQIEFVALTTGGSVNPQFATTDANGEARTTYRLSASTGLNTIEARLSQLPVASFTASALTGAVASIAIVSGNNQSGVVNTTLPTQLTVEARDAQGNVVQGAIINFQVPAGASAPNATTGANGRASSSYRLTTVAGSNPVRAFVGAVQSPVFNLTGTPDTAKKIVFQATPPPGMLEVDTTFVVAARATDQFDNPVATQPTISWTAPNQQLSSSSGASTNVTIKQMTDFTLTASSVPLTAASAVVNVRGFKPRVDLPSNATYTNFLVADMNNDTKPDVVGYGSTGIYVLINTTTTIGAPRFGTPIPFATNMNVRDVSIGKLNADNLPDLLVTHGNNYNLTDCNSGCIAVLRNSTSTGALTPILTHSIVYPSSASSAQLVDLNLDDRGDIVVASSSSDFTILFATSSGGFDAPQTVPRNGYGQLDSNADLNIDGRADLICDNIVHVNRTAVGSTMPSFTHTSVGQFSGFVDFDSDGKLDAVASQSSLQLHRNTTNPGSSSPSFQNVGSFGGSNLGTMFSSGDFNSDSRPDFAFWNGSQLSVFLNRIAGMTYAVSSATTLSLAASGYSSHRGIGSADFDGDGKTDVLAIATSSSAALLELFLAE